MRHQFILQNIISRETNKFYLSYLGVNYNQTNDELSHIFLVQFANTPIVSANATPSINLELRVGTNQFTEVLPLNENIEGITRTSNKDYFAALHISLDSTTLELDQVIEAGGFVIINAAVSNLSKYRYVLGSTYFQSTAYGNKMTYIDIKPNALGDTNWTGKFVTKFIANDQQYDVSVHGPVTNGDTHMYNQITTESDGIGIGGPMTGVSSITINMSTNNTINAGKSLSLVVSIRQLGWNGDTGVENYKSENISLTIPAANKTSYYNIDTSGLFTDDDSNIIYVKVTGKWL